MAVYNINGQPLTESSNVYISELKKTYPNYSDDALLDEAIRLAALQGKSTWIVWDGSNIYFSGQVQHDCSGFGGIDFAGSRIMMPAYDGGTIISVEPDSSSSETINASDIFANHTTASQLMGKIFTIGTVHEGHEDMCIGNRYNGSDRRTLYYVPTLMTDKNGDYASGPLYLVPQSGTVECHNIHDYPDSTFEICNATIVSYSGSAMSLFFKCSRSNVHVHDFVLEGRSAVTEFHSGVFRFEYCCDVRVDHISGVNPIQRANTSGYFVTLQSITYARVSDVYVGDAISWGAMGTQFIANTVFERCHLNRWDSHFAQWGYNVVRDCVLNQVLYGVGSGIIEFENCIISNNLVSDNTVNLVGLRSDVPGTFDGDIIIRNTVFLPGQQPIAKIGIWNDAAWQAKEQNSKIPNAGLHCRYIERCTIPDGCKLIFNVGSAVNADVSDYSNLSFEIRDTAFSSVGVVFDSPSSGGQQHINAVKIVGCQFNAERITGDYLKSNTVFLRGCIVGDNNVRVTQNTSLIVISDSDIGTVVSDQQSAALTMTGCRVNGDQSFSKFTNYAAYGNISGRGTQYTAALNGHI